MDSGDFSPLDGLRESTASAVFDVQGLISNMTVGLTWVIGILMFITIGAWLVYFSDGEFLSPLVEEGIGWVFGRRHRPKKEA
jgi:hypothetical protein